MEQFANGDGKFIVENLIKTIQENAAYLGEVDGAIGDGDHGINMNKGFTRCGEELEGKNLTLSSSLDTLGRILLMEIGGSMGPLYGTFFLRMAKVSKDTEVIDKNVFGEMLETALQGVQEIGGAKLGDKTLVDTLIPAVEAYKEAKEQGFRVALEEMKKAAKQGKESTRDLVAKVGRASRLGERSRGHLDAGATSCWLIMESFADSILTVI